MASYLGSIFYRDCTSPFISLSSYLYFISVYFSNYVGNDEYCLKEVRQYVSTEIGDQKDKLLQRLGKENNKGLSVEEAIENVPWLDLKKTLLKIERNDMMDHIEKNTLITEGNAEVYHTCLPLFAL